MIVGIPRQRHVCARERVQAQVADAVLSARVDKAGAVRQPARRGRIVRRGGEKTDHIHTPDPIAAELTALRERIEHLEKLLEEK